MAAKLYNGFNIIIWDIRLGGDGLFLPSAFSVDSNVNPGSGVRYEE
jgi:hypothetical protein